MAHLRTNFDAIGTKWSIEVSDDISSANWKKLLSSIRQRIEEFDKNYSRFRDDSLVTKISRQAGTYRLPTDGFAMLDFFYDLYKTTAGKLTPLIGQVMADAGYDTNYSLSPKPLAKPPAWEDMIEFNRQQIKVQQPALLDFGAAGKGYLIDIVGQLIEAGGVKNYVINAGGDIRARGQRLIRVGMENPFELSQAVGIVEIKNQAIAASAGSRRQWANFTHIIDPDELLSPTEIAASWVIAKSAMVADGLATALFFVEPIKLVQLDFAYAILKKDMELEYSKDFPVEVFEASK